MSVRARRAHEALIKPLYHRRIQTSKFPHNIYGAEKVRTPLNPSRHSGLDTDTVALTVKTSSSQLVTRDSNCPVRSFTDVVCPCRALLRVRDVRRRRTDATTARATLTGELTNHSRSPKSEKLQVFHKSSLHNMVSSLGTAAYMYTHAKVASATL
eukprot:4844652-Pyramimonas_sp.AAC.1